MGLLVILSTAGKAVKKIVQSAADWHRAAILEELTDNIAALAKNGPLKTTAWIALQQQNSDTRLTGLQERIRLAYDAIIKYQGALSAYYGAAGANDPRTNEFAQIASGKGEELMHTMRTIRGLLKG